MIATSEFIPVILYWARRKKKGPNKHEVKRAKNLWELTWKSLLNHEDQLLISIWLNSWLWYRIGLTYVLFVGNQYCEVYVIIIIIFIIIVVYAYYFLYNYLFKNLKVLRCQYKGGRRNILEGLLTTSTIADLQEKIWLMTDVPPHAQRSNEFL